MKIQGERVTLVTRALIPALGRVGRVVWGDSHKNANPGIEGEKGDLIKGELRLWGKGNNANLTIRQQGTLCGKKKGIEALCVFAERHTRG